MTQGAFVRRREADWRTLEKITAGKALSPEEVVWFPQAVRKLAGDLNTARAGGFEPALIERLNRLTAEGNRMLYGRKPFSWHGAAEFIFRTFPRSVRSQWRSFGACFLIFAGLVLWTSIICIRHPDYVYEIMSAKNAAALREMYDPGAEYYLKPREVKTDADMFGFYVYNNISIAFRTFAGGILAGAGSVLLLAVNAVFVGASAAHIINAGFQETFFSFIIGHSGFELTAIIFSAQGGLLLGYRLFVTRGRKRSASLREAGKTALPIISGSALMLLVAAVIEAFWSSRHEIPPEIRYAAGTGMILLLLAYFLFAGRETGGKA